MGFLEAIASTPLNDRYTMVTSPTNHAVFFFLFSGGGNAVIIGQKTPKKKLGTDVMVQLKASVRKAQRRQDGAEMELAARSVGESTDGAVLRAAMAVTAFVPGNDAPGDVENEVILKLPAQRPMILQDSEMEM